jgi:hypothetical protein
VTVTVRGSDGSLRAFKAYEVKREGEERRGGLLPAVCCFEGGQ